MFQIDQEYSFKMIEDGGQCSYHCRIIAVEGPLVEVMVTYQSKRIIINTHSSSFVSAEFIPADPDGDADWSEFT